MFNCLVSPFETSLWDPCQERSIWISYLLFQGARQVQSLHQWSVRISRGWKGRTLNKEVISVSSIAGKWKGINLVLQDEPHWRPETSRAVGRDWEPCVLCQLWWPLLPFTALPLPDWECGYRAERILALPSVTQLSLWIRGVPPCPFPSFRHSFCCVLPAKPAGQLACLEGSKHAWHFFLGLWVCEFWKTAVILKLNWHGWQ